MTNSRFVAIRKGRRLDDGVALSTNTTTADKRKRVIDDAKESDRARKLVTDGFERVTLDVDDPEATFQNLSDDERAFTRLGLAGAYLISAPEDEVDELVERHFGKDYYVVPNVPMELPKDVARGEIQPSIRRRQNVAWPEVSGIEKAHAEGITGFGVVVGVLDTGCDAGHAEFSNRPTNPIDFLYVNPSKPVAKITDDLAFDVGTHGTEVCSVVAGEHIGIAPDCELMVASVVSGDRTTFLERLLVGLEWLLLHFEESRYRDKPFILNISLGIDQITMRRPEFEVVGQALRDRFNSLAHEFDVLPIVAIGNDGPGGRLYAPGYYEDVFSVGAVDLDLKPATFSSYGIAPGTNTTQPDIAGFGVGVYVAQDRTNQMNSRYKTNSGTSFATPFVTGIAALYASQNPELQGLKLRSKLEQTALPLKGFEEQTGKGLARFVLGKDGQDNE